MKRSNTLFFASSLVSLAVGIVDAVNLWHLSIAVKKLGARVCVLEAESRQNAVKYC